MPPSPFDIPAALRRLATIFWTQFASIVLLGLPLLTLPSMLATAAFGPSPEGDLGTWVQTFLVLLAMVFVAAVNGGVLVTGGRGERPALFIRGGLATARPGVVVALLIGAVVMIGVIARLALRLGGVDTGLPGLVIFLALAAFLVAAFVGIPAAIVERLQPVPAIRRSVALTAGNRWRIAGFAGVILLGLIPAIVLVNTLLFGMAATPESAEAMLKTMTLLHPGLWIGELFWMLVFGFLAPAPAVVYLQLTGRR